MYAHRSFAPFLLIVCLVLICPLLLAEQNQPSPSHIHLSVQTTQTCEKLGACQGASEHDGFIYLYGDAKPGIIRQYTATAGDSPTLSYTGLEISLTRNGENIINHPTGLTWNPQFGTYLGNTVTATKKGTIYHLDWPRMLIDRNLDHAVLNAVDDDLAVQGCAGRNSSATATVGFLPRPTTDTSPTRCECTTRPCWSPRKKPARPACS